MSLFECMMTPCVFMVANRTPDGSGGSDTTWTEGATFRAAIVMDSSTEAKIADAAGIVRSYTVTVPRSVHLAYHAVIKRLTDGQIFRITSDSADKKTPVCAGLDMAQATAEVWRLTT